MYNSAIVLLEESAITYKNNIAIEDDKTSYTYEEYQNLSLSIGSYFIDKLNSKGHIGVYLPKSCKTLLSFMGILYSGNSYVPLDRNMPANRLLKILDNLEPNFIITDREGAGTLTEKLDFDHTKIIIYDDIIHTAINKKAIDKRLFTVRDTDPIYIMYTSGSTGNPKGVVIPHRGVIDYANWVTETFCFDEHTVLGNQAPFHFDNSVLDIYGGLKVGGKVIIIPEVFFNFPVKLPEYINQKKINTIFWVPTVLMNVANSNILDEIKMPKLKKVLFCGEIMPNKQLNIWRKTQVDIFYANLYGPTEITDVCTYYVVSEEFKDDEILPIGIACKNTGAIILNEEDQEATTNEIGELCILGSGLALGYFRAKEQTENAFVQNPLNQDYRELIYRTGDLAFKNEKGQITCLGRKDSQIKYKGNRIELGEIEAAAKALEEVLNACVLYDDSKQEIVLIVEINVDIKDRALLNKLRPNLPSYMVPQKLVKMDKIPLNANGKIDRPLLKTLLGSDK